MGDMKTPDFDDLLAAFDIPDATGLDAKESIQEDHEETESQLKHPGVCLDDGLLGNQAVNAADIPVVSVIVKNTSRQDSEEAFSDTLHSGPAVQNGLRGGRASVEFESSDPGLSKSLAAALNGQSPKDLFGKASAQHKSDETPIFSQSLSHFSPVSSPDQEDSRCSIRDEIHPTQQRCGFQEAPGLAEHQTNNPKKRSLSLFDACPKDSDLHKNTQKSMVENPRRESQSANNQTAKANKDHLLLPQLGPDYDLIPTSHLSGKSQESKLSSCLEALVALNARKDPSEPTNQRESLSSIPTHDCVRAGAKVSMSPRSPRSPLEAVKRLMRPSDSPVSICSDSSGKASPAMASGSPPAIPRVRIKTIKTTSGQIKRTVTSIVPDSETDDVQSVYESSPSQSMISEDSCCNVSPHQSQSASVESITSAQIKGLSVSTVSSKSLRNKPEMAVRKLGTKQSSTVFHNSSSNGKRSQLRQKLKKGMVSSTGSAAGTNFLPKAMHLASLNLVPHSVAASVAARSTTHQQSQHTLSSTVYSTVPLVHQVKTVSTCVPSTVPNTAAGTLNRLLNKANPVPTYKPNMSPPSNTNIYIPPRGYCCMECGDSFVVERSLVFHYSRRSVHIEVGCTHCDRTLVFFNKCALLAHAREHKSNGMVMQCTQLYMKPIAEEQMFVPLNTESGSMDPHPTPSSAPKSQPVMPLYPDNIIRHRLRCFECNKQLPDYKALAGHYQRLSEDTEGLICKVCSMLLPNKCSFRAHQRIHTHKSPYCCPECGALSRSADIQKHVKENCLHYTRKVWYKCLHCDMVFKTVQSQKSHVEERHCNVLYKCSICPVAFKSSESCEAHLRNKHKVNKMSPQLIFKCSCETVFKKKQLFFQHFYQNATKRVTYMFKCPECTTSFPQKHLLMQHFKSTHVRNTSANTEKNVKQTADKDAPLAHQQHLVSGVKNADIPRKQAEQSSRPHVKPTGWTCGECLQWFSERDSYLSHMKAEHRRSLKRYPCRHCDQSFKSATSLRRHIRHDHDGKKKIYTCWYCTDTKKIFATSVMLKNHISLMHGIKNPDLGLMPKTPESKKIMREGLHSKRLAEGTQEETPGHTNSPEGHPAKRLKTQFRCSKCGFVTEDGAQFRKHIPQHKSSENTPQCLHCGLCFTSPLALNRHLFIVHKVKDTREEEEQEHEVAAESVEKQQDNQPARTTEVNDSEAGSARMEPSHSAEAANLCRDLPLDCHVKVDTVTPTASPQ